MFNTISCHVINNVNRKDRYNNIKKNFSSKEQFQVTIHTPISNATASVSLWLTIKKIITTINPKNAYFILVEDDHEFCTNYSFELLKKSIEAANNLKADILCGGVSWFKTGVQISNELFWIEKFSGLQFTIIFKRFYTTILESHFADYDHADYKISDLTNKKFVIHPYISFQKDFGYSDVTVRNNLSRRVEKLFAESSKRLELLKTIKRYYTKLELVAGNLDEAEAANILIPLYSIVEKASINYELFSNEINFDQTVFQISKDDINQKWETLCQCIKQAQINSESFIVVSFDQIPLSPLFRKSIFINNIISANSFSCELLLGNIARFNHAVPVTSSLFWVDSFSYSSFIVLFSSLFERVTTTRPLEEENIYTYLSYLTSQKLALYPFIADIETIDIGKPKFQEKGDQLSIYKQVYQTYVKL